MKLFQRCMFFSVAGLLGLSPALALDISRYPVLVELVEVMSREDGYPKDELEAVLSSSTVDQRIIELMDKPYEALPWHRYRELFVKEARIAKGVLFWEENRTTLEAAEDRYGVPPEIIVSLIGVETHYGTYLGDRRVLDSLVTLSADYPRRSKFFSKELRTFLNTTRREKIAANSVLGSYAGAIGIPQFMPTSYESYAVDFNGNGKRDLVNEMEDAIGSVANYLMEHGWTRGETIYAPVSERLPETAGDLVSRRAKLRHRSADLAEAGVVFDARGGSEKAVLFSLTQVSGKDYVVGFRNFYALTRYNTSINYAMAVTELSMQIARRTR